MKYSSSIPQVLFRVRLGIDFPLPGVSNVKQLPSSNVIPGSSDYDATETEEVVEAAVDTETEKEEVKGEEDKVEVEEPEPCCDNLVSNTVDLVSGQLVSGQLVSEVSEETSEAVTEDISGNVKYEGFTKMFLYCMHKVTCLFEGV